MKKIIIIMAMFGLLFNLSCNNVNAQSYEIDDKKIEFYNGFIDSNEKEVFYGDKDVTEEFLNEHEDIINTKAYNKFVDFEKKGYVFGFARSLNYARSFEQRIKRYEYSGNGSAINYNNKNITCQWIVHFLCKYNVNANTGKISSVETPTLSLYYGTVSLFPGSVRLDNQSASIKEKGSNYVKFSYKFTVRADVQMGIEMKVLTFANRSGVEKL